MAGYIFTDKISDIGNETSQSKSYYERLADYIQGQGLLNDSESCNDLICRIENFIEQQIEELTTLDPYQIREFLTDKQ